MNAYTITMIIVLSLLSFTAGMMVVLYAYRLGYRKACRVLEDADLIPDPHGEPLH